MTAPRASGAAPARRYRTGLETRERILRAIRDLLADGGPDGATIKAICERAGVQPGSFYNLFESKEQAILTVIREAIQAVDPHPEGGPDRLDELTMAYVRFFTERPALSRIYLQLAIAGSAVDPGLGARVLRHHRARVERFAAAIHGERPDLSPAAAIEEAEAYVATLNGLALHLLLDPGFDLRGHAERLVQRQLHRNEPRG